MAVQRVGKWESLSVERKVVLSVPCLVESLVGCLAGCLADYLVLQ